MNSLDSKLKGTENSKIKSCVEKGPRLCKSNRRLNTWNIDLRAMCSSMNLNIPSMEDIFGSQCNQSNVSAHDEMSEV